MKSTGRTALITGATSGIGEVFAHRFASRGYDLIITGRREEKIRAVAARISTVYGVHVEVVTAELSNRDEIKALAERIRSTDSLYVLVNNAGFGAGKNTFQEGPLTTHLDMIRCHVEATVELTHAALPQMTARGDGAVINVSSIAGFLVFPTSSTYAPTKAYLNAFTEVLHMELAGTGVRVQALCPGFTKTDFHPRLGWDTSRMKSRGMIRWGTAEDVVDKSLEYLERGKVICIPGFLNRIVTRFLLRLPRRLYYRIASDSRDKE